MAGILRICTEPVVIEISVDKGRDRTDTRWSSLSGIYDLRVHINSGKIQNFNYQWLGGTASDVWQISIPFDKHSAEEQPDHSFLFLILAAAVIGGIAFAAKRMKSE